MNAYMRALGSEVRKLKGPTDGEVISLSQHQESRAYQRLEANVIW